MSNSIPTELPVSESNDEKIVKVAEETLERVPPPEIEPYKISFSNRYYKAKECQIGSLNTQNSVCALRIMRDVGVYFFDKNNFQRNTFSFIQIIHVGNANGYEALYSGLELDEIVYEIKCVKSQKKKGDIDFRIFFTLNDTARVFNVIAIREAHYATDK